VEKLLGWEIRIDFPVLWAAIYQSINIVDNSQPSSLSFVLALISKNKNKNKKIKIK